MYKAKHRYLTTINDRTIPILFPDQQTQQYDKTNTNMTTNYLYRGTTIYTKGKTSKMKTKPWYILKE